MQKITPCLWFNGNAEEAVKFYLSVFKKGKIRAVSRYTEGTPGEVGSVMTITFTLFGQEFVALNGGPEFKFNEAISLIVPCKTQREIDTYWRKLTANGGSPVQCGWLRDKFGLSWQIVPAEIFKLISGKDRAKATRVMKAVMEMTKLDLKALKKAASAKG